MLQSFSFMAVWFVIGFCVMAGLVAWGASIPIVYEDIDGTRCACHTDGDIATLSQCDEVDFDGLYEKITVSHCD